MSSLMGQISNNIKNFNEKLSKKNKQASAEASSEEDEWVNELLSIYCIDLLFKLFWINYFIFIQLL